MTPVEMLHATVPDPDRVALSLLHFLWQGALIFGVVRLVRWRFGSEPVVRYSAGLFGLLAMLVAPVGTYLALVPWSVGPAPEVGFALVEVPSPAATGPAAAGPVSPPDWQFAVVVMWAIGAIIGAVRTLRGWLCLRRLRIRAANAADRWQSWLADRSRQLRVTCPKLVVCSEAVTPMLVGWIRPAIVMPASVMSGLTPAQIESLLTHELIHLRRWDHIVNLLQVLLETLLFYHPVVWLLSRDLRHDRELCCDLHAAQALGRVSYVRALVAAEELRSAPHLSAARHAVAASGGSLVERIRFLVSQPEEGEPMHYPFRTHVIAVGIVVVTLVSLVGAGAVKVVEFVPAPDERARIYADINDGGAIQVIALGGGTPTDEVVAALRGLAEQLDVEVVYLKGQSDSVAVENVRAGLEAAGLQAQVRWEAPSAPSLTLPATLPVTLAEADTITVEVFDDHGLRLQTLVHEHRPAGEHEVTWRKEDYLPAPGIYFVRVQAGEYRQFRKVLVTR